MGNTVKVKTEKESELADRLKDLDDVDAWEEFVGLYWRPVMGVAIRRGCNHSDAEDVAQDTVTSVARHIGRFRTDPAAGSFRSWVMRIAYCRIADHFRRASVRTPQGSDLGFAAEDVNEFEPRCVVATDVWERLWAQEAQRRILNAAVERVRCRVSPKPYEAFRLSVWEEVPVTEISRRLGLRPGEIHLAKYRVRVLFQRELRRLDRAGAL